MDNRYLLDKIYKEIDTGGLSVLSKEAREKIKFYVVQAMEDGYNRGYTQASKEAAEDAAGASL